MKSNHSIQRTGATILESGNTTAISLTARAIPGNMALN